MMGDPRLTSEEECTCFLVVEELIEDFCGDLQASVEFSVGWLRLPSGSHLGQLFLTALEVSMQPLRSTSYCQHQSWTIYPLVEWYLTNLQTCVSQVHRNVEKIPALITCQILFTSSQACTNSVTTDPWHERVTSVYTSGSASS